MKPQTTAQILRCFILGRYTAAVVDGDLKVRGPQPLAGPLPASIEANRDGIVEFLVAACGGVWSPAKDSEFFKKKATEATKAPDPRALPEKKLRDESDRSNQRLPSFTPLTVSEALAEINRRGSGAGKNAELYRRGELSDEQAVEYVTCAILARRREHFGAWRQHAPAVKKALCLCIHELEPAVCKVCNGYVRRLIESEAGKDVA